MRTLKRYRLEIVCSIVLIFFLYILPAIYVITLGNDIKVVDNLLFVINPFMYFFLSVIYARYRSDFYIMPIASAILYIPSVFAIYSGRYLAVFFLYIITSLLGGIVGLKFSTDDEFLKAFKKAVGIMSIVGSCFIFGYTIVDNFLNRDYYTHVSINDFFDLSDITNYFIILLLILLAYRCLRKNKKKKGKKSND